MKATEESPRSPGGRIRGWARRLPAFAERLLRGMVCFVYPPACAGCSQPLLSEEWEPFCPDCQKALDLVREPYCPRCGIPFPVDSQGPHLCGECLVDAYHFDRARSAGLYRGLLRDVIHRFKYERKLFLVRPLAQMLIAPGTEVARFHKAELIVPVPLHPKRLRERGFNQAALLARRLGANLGISVNYSSLKRSRWTKPQIGLSRSQRAANVKGAFQLARAGEVRGKRILLLDDVFTTGETVNQCARVLKVGGAREVVVLTLARTVPM